MGHPVPLTPGAGAPGGGARGSAGGLDPTTLLRRPEDEVGRLLAPAGRQPQYGGRAAPDYAEVHRELKRPGVTLTLLWEAVSYTHLRAHETVLDLVCRLLLEKKK